MEPIDPNDQTTREETEKLLEKSKALKEKAKATSEKLDELKKNSEKLMGDQHQDSENNSVI